MIKASRGRILDTNGIVLADNKTVCTISVIHSQIQDDEAVIHMLTSELGLDEAQVRKRWKKNHRQADSDQCFQRNRG